MSKLKFWPTLLWHKILPCVYSCNQEISLPLILSLTWPLGGSLYFLPPSPFTSGSFSLGQLFHVCVTFNSGPFSKWLFVWIVAIIVSCFSSEMKMRKDVLSMILTSAACCTVAVKASIHTFYWAVHSYFISAMLCDLVRLLGSVRTSRTQSVGPQIFNSFDLPEEKQELKSNIEK